MRLIGSPVHKEMAIQLVTFMSRIYPPALGILLTYVDPGQQLLRDLQFLALLRQTQSK